MSLDTLATLRDVAILILFVQGLIVLSAMLALAYLTQRGLRRGLAKTRPLLRQGCETIEGVLRSVRRGAGRVAAPFVWALSTWTGLRRGLAVLRHRLDGGRSTWTTT